MSETQIFNPDTKEWEDINDPDSQWQQVSSDDNNNEGEVIEPNTEPIETIYTVDNCNDIGKRHKFKDRQTGIIHDTCLVCGAERPTPGQSTSSKPRVSTGGKKASGLESILSALWMGAGMVIKTTMPKPVGPAVGKTMQIEGAIAGSHLHKALKKTPIYPYLAIAESQLSWVTDLATLLLPPLLVGAIAYKPEIGPALKPMLVAALVPALAEASKKAKEQAALLEQLEGYSDEVISAAFDIVDHLISPDEDDNEEKD